MRWQHAVVEQAFRDLKDQALANFPSGHYPANAAWTVIAAIAHNLMRWTALIGLPDQTRRAARTLRRRLITQSPAASPTAPGNGRCISPRWPWEADFIRVLTTIRALSAA